MKSPFAKETKRVFDLDVVDIAILVDDEQVVAVVSKKRESLFDFQSPFDDDQILFTGHDARKKLHGFSAMRKDGMHEKITEQGELLNQKIVCFIRIVYCQIFTSCLLYT